MPPLDFGTRFDAPRATNPPLRGILAFATALLVGAVTACGGPAAPAGTGVPGGPTTSATIPVADPQQGRGTRTGSPLDELPPHISVVRLPAEIANPSRLSWSPDGTRLVMLDALIGNVWEYDLATGKAVQLTGDPHLSGVLRADYLPNGDLVLCAPPDRNPANPAGDRIRGELWLMQQPLGQRPLVRLGAPCWEGVAVTRTAGSTRIAWTESNVDFTSPDAWARTIAVAKSHLFVGRIDYTDPARPVLADRRDVLDATQVPDRLIETQDFRGSGSQGGVDNELVFSSYGYRGSEVLSVNLQTGAIVDYSLSPFWEEAEGVEPAGRWELVERNRPSPADVGAKGETTDLWRLTLDGTATWDRLTYFTPYAGFGAGNPVVAPDGSRFVFQLDREGAEPGDSFGLLLFDLKAWDASGQVPAAPESDRLAPYGS